MRVDVILGPSCAHLENSFNRKGGIGGCGTDGWLEGGGGWRVRSVVGLTGLFLDDKDAEVLRYAPYRKRTLHDSFFSCAF